MKVKEVRLTREPCYGKCPVYEVRVRSDGTVRWNGQMFVKTIGEATWTLEPGRFQEIEEALRKARFDELDNKYDSYMMTDASSAEITVVYENGRVKKVSHYHGDSSAPRTLTWLENKIDKITGTRAYSGYDWDEDEEEGNEDD